MADYIPTLQITDLYKSPSNKSGRTILNSGFLLTYNDLVKYQKVVTDAIRKDFKDYLKWPGISKQTFAHYIDDSNKAFDLLSHEYVGGLNKFLINSGTAYLGDGNRLSLPERTYVSLSFPGSSTEAYLCCKFGSSGTDAGVVSIDYIEHPVYGTPIQTKVLLNNILFYLTDSIFEAALAPITINEITTQYPLYYPSVNADGIIDGIIIAKVTKNATVAPDISYKTLWIGIKNSQPLDVLGFVDMTPST
jgi:hypothetical protein